MAAIPAGMWNFSLADSARPKGTCRHLSRAPPPRWCRFAQPTGYNAVLPSASRRWRRRLCAVSSHPLFANSSAMTLSARCSMLSCVSGRVWFSRCPQRSDPAFALQTPPRGKTSGWANRRPCNGIAPKSAFPKPHFGRRELIATVTAILVRVVHFWDMTLRAMWVFQART